jgi:DNA-binding transcriptional MerR regulator
MLLKIGELAKRTGLTVRALHHYDAIGLLKPSARSEAGYRLYNRTDIARLHQIQALRRFGLALAEIGTSLASPDMPLADLVSRQIDMLTRQIEQADTLRARLVHMRTQLQQGQTPELAEWLTTMELMTMYDKYFSPDELKQLPMYADASLDAEWKAMVAQVREQMDSGASPEADQAQALAKRWMALLARATAGNPSFMTRLNAMHEQEPEMRERSGITPELQAFVLAASQASKLAIYRRYLDDDEYRFAKENYGRRSAEWPPLVAQVRAAMDAGTPATDAAVKRLAWRWFDLFRSYAGDSPETQARFRLAHEKEPELLATGWVDKPMIEYLKQAMAALQQDAAESGRKQAADSN